MPRNHFIIFIGILAVVLGVFVHGESRAAFNTQINYQGKLTDTSDAAVADGDYNFIFRLCATSDCTGGSDPLWTETRETTNKVTVTSGIFSVLLGEVTSIASVDFNQSLWLEVQVGGTGSSPSYETLTPRKKLGAVPAAFEADKLDGIDSLSFVRSDAADTVSGLLTITAAPTGSGVGQGSLYINPSSAAAGQTLLGLAVGGTEKFRLDAEGDLVLAGDLAVDGGDITSSGALTITPGAGTNLNIALSTTGDFAVNTDDLYVDTSTGNVGIGTTSPGQKLTLNQGVFLQTAGGAPTNLGGLDLAASEGDVFVSGKYAYIVHKDAASDFKIVDITDPANPATVGTANDGEGDRTFVSGKYAYVVTPTDAGTCSGATITGCEFSIYDISDPSTPAAVSGVDIGSDASAVFVAGKYAYIGLVGGATNEFRIYDISDPNNPAQTGVFEHGSSIRSIYVTGKYAYVGYSSDFHVIDISDPTSPSNLGSVSTGNDVETIYVLGRYAYMAIQSITGTCSGVTLTGCEFRIYDISNPTSITAVGGYETSDIGVFALALAGKYAYIGLANAGAGTDDIQILDISTLASPTKVGGVDLGASILFRSLVISGKYLYAVHDAEAGNEFHIYDITGVDAPSATIGSIAANYLSIAGNARVDENLYVGSTVNVGVGGVFSQGSGSFFSSASTTPALTLQNTANATSTQVAIFRGNNPTTATDNDEAYFSFDLEDDLGAQAEFARLTWQATDVTNTTKDGLLKFSTQVANTLTDALAINGNKVGIGTTSPDYLLELSAAAASDPSFALSDGDVAHGITGLAQTDVFSLLEPLNSTSGGLQLTGLSDTDATGLQLRGIVGSSTPSATTPAIKFVGAKASSTTIQDLGATETLFQVANNDDAAALTILGDGKVGIGTVSPATTLTVEQTSSGGIGINSVGTDINATIFLQLDGTTTFTMGIDDSDADKFKIGTSSLTTDTRVTIDSDGRIGLGTDTTPTEGVTMSTEGTAGITGFGASMFNDGNADTKQGMFIQACKDDSPTSACNLLELRDGNGTVLGAIEGDGAGGVTNASAGSDYAELFPGEFGEFESGDVVSLGDNGRAVKAEPGSAILGVMSTTPNTLGNWKDGWEESGEWVPVGLLGQIPTKASLENGPIQRGDKLAVASEPGVAMRATEPGDVIGTALEPFAEGDEDGKVLVLVRPHWSMGVFDDDGFLDDGDDGDGDSGEPPADDAKPQKPNGMLAALKKAVEGFTGTVKLAGNWVFEKITAKTARVEKIELVDQATGKTYCTWIENGEWMKQQGECTNNQDPSNNNQTNSNNQNSNDQNTPPPAPSEPEPVGSSDPTAPSNDGAEPEPEEPVEEEPPVEAEEPAESARQDVPTSGGDIQAGPPPATTSPDVGGGGEPEAPPAPSDDGAEPEPPPPPPPAPAPAPEPAPSEEE